jgi:hypothetical protein
MEKMVRVRARVQHTDATDRQPRSPGEVYALEEERARRKARQGFVDLVDENGRIIAPDAPELPAVDVVIEDVLAEAPEPRVYTTKAEPPKEDLEAETDARKPATKTAAAKRTTKKG